MDVVVVVVVVVLVAATIIKLCQHACTTTKLSLITGSLISDISLSSSVCCTQPPGLGFKTACQKEGSLFKICALSSGWADGKRAELYEQVG